MEKERDMAPKEGRCPERASLDGAVASTKEFAALSGADVSEKRAIKRQASLKGGERNQQTVTDESARGEEVDHYFEKGYRP